MTRDVTALGATRTLTSVRSASDKAVGWLALNASSRARAVGGIRCTPDLDVPRVQALADAMSWKFAWLGMPMGGAKAGLVQNPEWTADTRRTFAWFLASPNGFMRSLVRTVAEIVKERWQARRQEKRELDPRGHRPWSYTMLRALTNALLRELLKSSR